MNNFFEGLLDKNVLSVNEVIVFTIFCFLLEGNNQTQSFTCSFEITYKF
jgi:hypothetical protein